MPKDSLEFVKNNIERIKQVDEESVEETDESNCYVENIYVLDTPTAEKSEIKLEIVKDPIIFEEDLRKLKNPFSVLKKLAKCERNFVIVNSTIAARNSFYKKPSYFIKEHAKYKISRKKCKLFLDDRNSELNYLSSNATCLKSEVIDPSKKRPLNWRKVIPNLSAFILKPSETKLLSIKPGHRVAIKHQVSSTPRHDILVLLNFVWPYQNASIRKLSTHAHVKPILPVHGVPLYTLDFIRHYKKNEADIESVSGNETVKQIWSSKAKTNNKHKNEPNSGESKKQSLLASFFRVRRDTTSKAKARALGKVSNLKANKRFNINGSDTCKQLETVPEEDDE